MISEMINEARPGRLIAGVGVPDTPLITAAIEYAQRLSESYLFNHAMRSCAPRAEMTPRLTKSSCRCKRCESSRAAPCRAAF